MKVLIIKGSYHNNGVIGKLVNSFIEGFRSKDLAADVEIIDLLETDINFCKGCASCAKNDGKELGECVQKDNMAGILRKMLDCNRIVFATPIYEESVTALLKRFMERCMPMIYLSKHGPVGRNELRSDKKGLVIVSCSTPFPYNILFGVAKYPINILSKFCKGFRCSKVYSIKAGGADLSENVLRKYMQKAHEMGVKLGY